MISYILLYYESSNSIFQEKKISEEKNRFLYRMISLILGRKNLNILSER